MRAVVLGVGIIGVSYDHRATDGALAARFCATLKHLLADVRRIIL